MRRRRRGPRSCGLRRPPWGMVLGVLPLSVLGHAVFNSLVGAATATAAFQLQPPQPLLPATWRSGATATTRSRIRRSQVMMMAAVAAGEEQDFLGRLTRSLVEERTFVRLTLTNSGGSKGSKGGTATPGSDDPQQQSPPVDKLLARLIEGTAGASGDPRVQLVYTHPFSSTTKTLALGEAPAAIAECVQAAVASSRLKASRLFTTEGDWVLERSKSGLRLYRNKATYTSLEVGAHDRAKKRRLAMPGLEEGDDAAAGGAQGAAGGVKVGGFMEVYGILDARGQPKKGMRDKHRQIERFVEILEAQLKQWGEAEAADGGHGNGPRRQRLRLLDAGCGRGLLTFAAYEYLTSLGYDVEARGVDIRPDVVSKANAVADSLGYSPGLTFMQGSIAGLAGEEEGQQQKDGEGAGSNDIVIALHACDTASDDALHLGIRRGAGIILASPCCHKEVRREMKRAMKQKGAEQAVGIGTQAAVLRHGILLERTAEIVTDSLRALCLESQGYRAQVMEWINDEATSKNLMLTATRRRGASSSSSSEQQQQAKAVKQIQALMGHWGLRTQHLARLLGLLEGRID